MSNPLPARNEPCHCGSGKKYKQCCLAKDETAARESRATAEQAAPAREATESDATEKVPERVQRQTKHQTSQPWKRAENRGFPKLNVPRRIGNS
jgi:hypothetical protein